jgi:SAM-dependent methyltransferase
MNAPGRLPDVTSEAELARLAGSGPGPGGDGPDAKQSSALAWREWLASPAGQYVVNWEQQQFDRLVPDLFGFVGLQLGLRELDTLANNRMRSRILVSRGNMAAGYGMTERAADIVIESYEDLPFADQSADLVTLPHVLEFAADPHQVLREVDRVLRPEGRIIVTGFNPVSLWGAAQAIGGGLGRPFIPADGQFISLPRLRDWYKLLSFQFTRGSYGCYRPACRSERWLARTEFLEKAGDRWWPICGAVYCVSAVKRVRGMRVIGPAWRRSRSAKAGRVVPSPTYAPRTPQPAVPSADKQIVSKR